MGSDPVYKPVITLLSPGLNTSVSRKYTHCLSWPARTIRPLSFVYKNAARIISVDFQNYSTLNKVCCSVTANELGNSLLKNKQVLDIYNNISAVPVRTVTKFSLKRGKRKTVKAALRRFFRLHWGGWIRPKVGRQKKLWKKSSKNKRKLREHVFCNATQATLLDKMVTKVWKKPKYYVDDVYAPYHTREEFYATRKNPIVRNPK